MRGKVAVLVFVLAWFGAVAGIVVPKNGDDLLPLGRLDDNRITIVAVGDENLTEFYEVCRKYAPVEMIELTAEDKLASLETKLEDADILIPVVSADTKFTRHAVTELERLTQPKVAVFLMPDKKAGQFKHLEKFDAILIVDEDEHQAQSVAAQALFGGVAVDGRLHHGIHGVAKKGRGVDLLKTRLGFSTPEAEGLSDSLQIKIDSIAAKCLEAKAFPGCQIVVVKNGNVIIDSAYGKISAEADAGEVTTETVYDLASMTKATATLGGVMKCYDMGAFSLDDVAADYIPELGANGKGDITISDLLYHVSGLPAGLNITKLVTDTASYDGKLISYKRQPPYTIALPGGAFANSDARMRRDFVAFEKSDEYPYPIAKGIYGSQALLDSLMTGIYRVTTLDRRYRYSDLNFCLLRQLQENVSGTRIDQWVDLTLFKPLGAYRTMFLPAENGYPLRKTAATETDNFLRRQQIHGYVHDETSAFSGGVQGNAGLFSTAEDIAKFCQMLLYKGQYGGEQLLDSATVKLFTESNRKDIKRGLGFDLAMRYGSLRAIGNVPESVYGHTGFTGTSFWIDPDNQLICIFLSNRVCPSRDNPAFDDLNPRSAVMRAVYESLPSFHKDEVDGANQ